MLSSKKSVFTCDWCKKEFVEWTYRHSRFCSNQCRSEYAARQPKPKQRRPENFVVMVCEYCKSEYRVHKSQLTKSKPCRFCSRACQYHWLSDSMHGKDNRMYRGGTAKLKDYGKSWFHTKRLILDRDGHKCAYCGEEKKRMDVHHIIKLRYFNGDTERANNPNNLITLCPQCHKGIELGKIELKLDTLIALAMR